MSQLVLLAVCLVAGILLRRFGEVPAAAHRGLNAVVLHLALPALVLLRVHDLPLEPALLMAAAMPWLVFAFGTLFFFVLARRGVVSRETMGCLILTCALGNTSFVGLPMIETFYGVEHLGIGLVADQLGTFLCLAIPGMLMAARFANGGVVAPGSTWRRVLLFPPFVAVLAALVLRPVEYPSWAVVLLERLGSTLTPLALVSVGLQLSLGALREHSRGMAVGLLYKLLLAPAAALAVFAPFASGAVLQVTVFEAAMAPMITGAIVAQEHELDAPLAALMVGIGIPLSFLTLPVWWWLLRFF